MLHYNGTEKLCHKQHEDNEPAQNCANASDGDQITIQGYGFFTIRLVMEHNIAEHNGCCSTAFVRDIAFAGLVALSSAATLYPLYSYLFRQAYGANCVPEISQGHYNQHA